MANPSALCVTGGCRLATSSSQLMYDSVHHPAEILDQRLKCPNCYRSPLNENDNGSVMQRKLFLDNDLGVFQQDGARFMS